MHDHIIFSKKTKQAYTPSRERKGQQMIGVCPEMLQSSRLLHEERTEHWRQGYIDVMGSDPTVGLSAHGQSPVEPTKGGGYLRLIGAHGLG